MKKSSKKLSPFQKTYQKVITMTISMNDPEFIRYTYFRLFLVFFGGGMVVTAVLEEAVLSPLPGDTALALELLSSSKVDGVETIGVMWAIAGPI